MGPCFRRDDEVINTLSRPRGATRPRYAFISRPEEGAGKAGCALHPRSRVQDAQKNAHTSIQVQRRQSGLPCAMVLTAYFVLSPVIGLSCHRRPAKPGMSAPGWADFAFARLDAGVEASGPHDFTVRGRLAPRPSTGVVPIRRSPGEGVFGIVRQRAPSSLTGEPALRHFARPTLPRPPHPAPTFVTMANAPLRSRTRGVIERFGYSENQNIFSKGAGQGCR
jgi:hypothetical protein